MKFRFPSEEIKEVASLDEAKKIIEGLLAF